MKTGLLTLSILFCTLSNMVAQNKLIYVGDPMCSWCYGFAPELKTLVEQNKESLEVEIVTGGLRPYFEKPITEMKDFLTHHWEDVNKASGQPFNYGILDREGLNYDTEPGCRAVVVVRHMNPEVEFDFFKSVQKAFYYENKDLRDIESYNQILDVLCLDKEEFKKRFNSDEYKELVKQDFQRSSELGVTGFPTLLLQTGENTQVLVSGYAPAEQIQRKIDSIIN